MCWSFYKGKVGSFRSIFRFDFCDFAVAFSGWFDVPDGLVFSYPVMFTSKGYWNVCQDIDLSSDTKGKLQNIVLVSFHEVRNETPLTPLTPPCTLTGLRYPRGRSWRFLCAQLSSKTCLLHSNSCYTSSLFYLATECHSSIVIIMRP